jgi:hypothetical protein
MRQAHEQPAYRRTTAPVVPAVVSYYYWFSRPV